MSKPMIRLYRMPHAPAGKDWCCDIEEGPGHHGVGSSQAEALYRAAQAWMLWDTRRRDKPIPRSLPQGRPDEAPQ